MCIVPLLFIQLTFIGRRMNVKLCIKHLVLSFSFSVLNAKFVAIQIIFGGFYRHFSSISVRFCRLKLTPKFFPKKLLLYLSTQSSYLVLWCAHIYIYIWKPLYVVVATILASIAHICYICPPIYLNRSLLDIPFFNFQLQLNAVQSWTSEWENEC